MHIEVIGDSHGRSFWSGQNHLNGPDSVPDFSTTFTGGYTAYSLTLENHESRKRWMDRFNELKLNEYNDWIMVSHGEVDARFRLRELSEKEGYQVAVKKCVDRYADFLIDIYSKHNKLCVWACPATSKPGTHLAEEGTDNEIERNIISYLFNKHLSERLLSYKIPIFGVLPLMINDDGTTKESTTYDKLHAKQDLRPKIEPIVRQYLKVYETVDSNSLELQHSCYDHKTADQIFFRLLK